MSDQDLQPAITPPIACDLSERDLAARRDTLARDLFRHVEEVRELDDGFAYRYPSFEPWGERLLEFIAVERRCCPFFTFELTVEPNDGPIWLRLRGSPEIKAFIRDQVDASA